MIHKHLAVCLMVALLGLVSGCSAGKQITDTPTASSTAVPSQETFDRTQAEAIAWEVLEPISRSKDRANWLVLQSEQVQGRDVEDEIPDQAQFGCFHEVEPNPPIVGSKIYWYVVFKPAPATPMPLGRTPSPTEPPAIPEPFIQEARFLVDPESAQVVAQAVYCVIY